MPEVVDAVPKKIILCCDGTSQSSVSGEVNLPSNVTRIARTIAKAGEDGGKVWQQLVFYDSGVGTGSLSAIEAKRQGATGDGLIVNVLEAYNFVVNNYSPGDKIYCFGFSRGAFTARAIAGMITDFGVIKPEQMKHFPSLFAAYKKNLNKYNFRKTKEYFEWYAGKAPFVPESQKETVYPKIPWYDMGAGEIAWEDSRSVELVGVFDTVGSLGSADTYVHSHAADRKQYEWLNVKWNPFIQHAFHALSIDDRRQPFLPTLYYIPKKEVIADENKELEKDEVDWPELTEHRRRIDEEFEQAMADNKKDLIQVWFTGVHINVGGGTDQANTDYEALANITFAWMVEQCKPYLAFDTFTNATLANYIQRMKEHALERKAREDENPSGIVGKAGRTITDAGKWVGSFWPFSSSDKTEPKEKMIRSYCFSVENPNYGETPHWTLFRVQDSYSTMYKAISNPQDRTPGQCDDRSTEAHTPLYKLGETNEFMHPSVKWRIDMSQDHKEKDHQYKPKPLAVFDYKQRDGVYGWEHKTDKNGNAEKKVWIPEWPITAALQDEDPESYAENAEMALIDQCKDKADVREFLKKHADAWVKAYSSKL